MKIEDLDARSLALHRQVAEKIRGRPELLRVAVQNLARWEAGGATDPQFDDWQQVLNAGLQAALALATEDSDRGALMRRSSPFAGILTSTERGSLLTAWRIVHETK